MRSRSAQISLTLICFIVGVLLMFQFRTQGTIAKTLVAESAADQTAMIGSLYDSNLALRREVERLSVQQLEYERTHDETDLMSVVNELNKLRIFNSLSEVSGPGVELIVPTQVRAEDILDLINELRNAGAEAIAINGQRVAVNTSITTYQNSVVLDTFLVEPPFVFQAIGHPDTLEKALERRGGMVAYLRNTYPDAEIVLVQQPRLILPIFKGSTKL